MEIEGYRIFKEAQRIRERYFGEETGVIRSIALTEPGCSVNCKFCSISSQYVGKSNDGRLREGFREDVRNAMEELRKLGNAFIELVGCWWGPSSYQVYEIAEIVKGIRQRGLRSRADIGFVSENDMQILAEVLDVYHNNLETLPHLYPTAVGKSEARFWRKVKMIELARRYGIEVGSGILIGLGETLADVRVMARFFNEMDIPWVSTNVLETRYLPSGLFKPVSVEEALVKLAILRTNLREDQHLILGYGWSQFRRAGRELGLRIADTIRMGALTKRSYNW